MKDTREVLDASQKMQVKDNYFTFISGIIDDIVNDENKPKSKLYHITELIQRCKDETGLPRVTSKELNANFEKLQSVLGFEYKKKHRYRGVRYSKITIDVFNQFNESDTKNEVDDLPF